MKIATTAYGCGIRPFSNMPSGVMSGMYGGMLPSKYMSSSKKGITSPLKIRNTSPTKARYLTGALSYGRYTLPRGIDITVIGEEHSMNFKPCPNQPQIHVSDYIREKMSSSKELTLLMEYPPKKSIDSINYYSINMKEIKDVILRLGAEDRTIGIDTRRDFINSDLLYGKEVNKLTYGELLKNMWDPLTPKEVFAIPPEKGYRPEEGMMTEYLPSDYAFLKEYVGSKKKSIEWFYKKILKTLPLSTRISEKKIFVRESHGPQGTEKQDVVEFFRRIWADVSDKRILEILLRSKNNSSYVIVVGYQHAKNLRTIFSKFETFYSHKTASHCIVI